MGRKLFCLVFLILLGIFASGATKPKLSINVRDFGATGDGKTKDTEKHGITDKRRSYFLSVLFCVISRLSVSRFLLFNSG